MSLTTSCHTSTISKHSLNLSLLLIMKRLLWKNGSFAFSQGHFVFDNFTIKNKTIKKLSWRCRGSNPGPFTCKANALPLSHIPIPVLLIKDVRFYQNCLKLANIRKGHFLRYAVENIPLCTFWNNVIIFSFETFFLSFCAVKVDAIWNNM